MVDLYDFAGHGKHVAVVVSAMWSIYDRNLAEGILNNEIGSSYGTLPQKVNNGEIYLITIIVQNDNGSTPSPADLQSWYSDFQNPLVPVLADTVASDYYSLYVQAAFPTIVVFDENMQYVSGPTGTEYFSALTYIDNL